MGNQIYIPLWSYSNVTCSIIGYLKGIFTFHYGPIQMQQSQSCICNFRIYIPLWSYSNSDVASYRLPLHHLHSTMVLFKLCCSGTPRYFKLFTFHYGPIQINFTCYTFSLFSGIYIPLWSYSNKNVSLII